MIKQDEVNKLRHYLDTVMYASPGINVWSTSEEAKDSGKRDDIERLKREIRGVKGVLLSAKMFPGAPGRAGG